MSEYKIYAKNKKAYFEYVILDKIEAGIELQGTEVKAIRNGKISLVEGWVDINQDDIPLLKQVHISPYKYGNIYNHDETRIRRLLLKKIEIIKLKRHLEQKGASLVPLQIHSHGQFIKILVGIARGKKLHDKRAASKEKDAKIEIHRALKQNI